jgi:hypothetical protein
MPIGAAKSGIADYHAPVASVRHVRGGKLPCRLPVAFKGGLRLQNLAVLEEADESLFWLELLLDSGVVEPDKIRPLLRETNELVSIFVASLRTVKGLKSEI